jgi:predicted glycosyltransferase
MRVWVDIENAPQAWFFRPVLRALRARGAEVVVSVRDYGEAVALLAAAGERFTVVGRASGGARVMRAAAVLTRALALARFARARGFDVAVSHGVRPHLAAAALLGVPCITGYDYEHASKLLVHRLACEVLVPRVLLERYLRPAGADVRKVAAYDGLKEEVYLGDFVPEESIYEQLQIDRHAPLVTVRPPSFHAHYATEQGNRLFFGVLDALRRRADCQIVVAARDSAQRAQIERACGGDPRVIVPLRPVDGLNLIWHSDLVISGGGTMAREAALLGVPAISIFRGTPGIVDAHLVETGRLRRVVRAEDLEGLALPSRRERPKPVAKPDLVSFIVDRIAGNAQRENAQA